MIYVLWLWKNNPMANAAFAKTSPEERSALDQALDMEKYGAEWVLYCNSTWASEEYRSWGITSYQTLAGRIAQTRALEEAGWFKWAEMVSLMGSLVGEVRQPDFPDPIYQLWISRSNPQTMANGANESQAEKDERWGKWRESVDKTGASLVLYCNSAWCDEGRPSFGVMAYPSLEARIEHVADCQKLNWPLFFDVFTLLGVTNADAA